MTNYDLILRFGSALLIGVLIGLQREYAYGDPSGGLFAGARTFALMSLFGATAAFLSDVLGATSIFVGMSAVLALMVIVAYFIGATNRGEVGLTTEVAALVTILIGAVCYAHSVEFATALGVLVTVLLAIKWEMRNLVQVLTREDVFATLQFAVITAIILPILPNKTYGPPPLDVLNPYKVWQMVVFISGINFLGYILIKIVGPKRGIGISGLLGGLASSTANTLSFSQRSNTQPELNKPFGVAIIIGWTIMFARVLVEVAVVNNRLLPMIWPSMVAMGAAGLIYSIYLYLSQAALDEEQMDVSNPFELAQAIKFGLVYAIVLVISKAAEVYLGEEGLYFSSFVAGLADVDAITLSVAGLSQGPGGISIATAKRAIILAAVANTVVKGGMVLSLGSKKLRWVVWPAFVVIILIGLVFAFIF
ncbi:MAG: MgtC/SapB family protein [Anaerolineales bacterium]